MKRKENRNITNNRKIMKYCVFITKSNPLFIIFTSESGELGAGEFRF